MEVRWNCGMACESWSGFHKRGRRNGVASDFFPFSSVFFRFFRFSLFSSVFFRFLPFFSVSFSVGRHRSRDPFCETPSWPRSLNASDWRLAIGDFARLRMWRSRHQWREAILFTEWRQGIQWMKALVRSSTGKTIHWRGSGHSSETGRIRFQRVRFQTPNSVSFSGLTEFRGANSVSSSRSIICVPKRTHRVFHRTHRVCRKTQWDSVSSLLRNSALETVFRPFPHSVHRRTPKLENLCAHPLRPPPPKKKPKDKVSGQDPGTSGTHTLGYPDPGSGMSWTKTLCKASFFCCFKQGMAGISRALGRDVPGSEKRKFGLGWFSFPNLGS